MPKTTKPQDVGHLGQATEASKHHHDKMDADHTSEAELIAYNQRHEREQASKELTKAREEYMNRDHHTKTQDVGHLGQVKLCRAALLFHGESSHPTLAGDGGEQAPPRQDGRGSHL